MVLQNIGGGSAESVTVGCLDWDRFDRQWQDCVQDCVPDYRYHPRRDVNRNTTTPHRSENLRRNLPSFRVLRLLATIGVALLALAYAVYLVNPIEIAINVRMSFLNGSFLFGLWRKPPVSIYVQVYLFNVTNPREFLRGQEKLRVEEVGPFVYREELENTDVKFNENDTVTYTPKRNVFAVPELSVGDPHTTRVIAPNLALLGLASSLHNSSIFTNLAFATLTTYLDTQPFLPLTVHEFLWGFDDPLVHLASKLFPKWIHFPRLGVMDRMFDDGKNVVTMNIYGDDDGSVPSADLAPAGTNDSFSRRAFAIDSWNGSPGLAHWGYGDPYDRASAGAGTRCNTIRGATEGILFPRNIRKDMRFSVYRKAFCRTLPLQFVREGPTPDQVPAYWYTLGDDIFETADVNPDNGCYCRPDVAPCLPRGLSDLTPCYYGPVGYQYPGCRVAAALLQGGREAAGQDRRAAPQRVPARDHPSDPAEGGRAAGGAHPRADEPRGAQDQGQPAGGSLQQPHRSHLLGGLDGARPARLPQLAARLDAPSGAHHPDHRHRCAAGSGRAAARGRGRGRVLHGGHAARHPAAAGPGRLQVQPGQDHLGRQALRPRDSYAVPGQGAGALRQGQGVDRPSILEANQRNRVTELPAYFV